MPFALEDYGACDTRINERIGLTRKPDPWSLPDPAMETVAAYLHDMQRNGFVTRKSWTKRALFVDQLWKLR